MEIMTNKQKYLSSVRFCLESMLYIAQGDSEYLSMICTKT